MLPAGFEPTIPAVERLRAYALGHRATGIGPDLYWANFQHVR